VSKYGANRISEAILRLSTSSIGDKEAAERALERNLLAGKINCLFTIQTPLSTTEMVTHTLKIIAILKLPKLALCPLPAIMTQSRQREGRGQENFPDMLG
jgi:hypothetical protein